MSWIEIISGLFLFDTTHDDDSGGADDGYDYVFME
jgi:hypothetical protein